MKAYLITSAVNFVPNNYDKLVLSLAKENKIEGLIVVDNRSWDVVFKALALILSLKAPRFGWQLLKNLTGSSMKKRYQHYGSLGKTVEVIQDLNSESSIQYLKSLQADLFINARTRAIFKPAVLELPSVGCINIHHGLLPDQRGLMCDFWAHIEGGPAGFSVHEMTRKVDDGGILQVVEVPADTKCFMNYLERSTDSELKTITKIIAQVAESRVLNTQPNLKILPLIYRKNPRLGDFSKLTKKGIRI